MAAFSFGVDFPFDGTGAFLQNDKMYHTCHVISSSVWAALSTISLSLNINISVIVNMPHVASLGGLYYACICSTLLSGALSQNRKRIMCEVNENKIIFKIHMK